MFAEQQEVWHLSSVLVIFITLIIHLRATPVFLGLVYQEKIKLPLGTILIHHPNALGYFIYTRTMP